MVGEQVVERTVGRKTYSQDSVWVPVAAKLRYYVRKASIYSCPKKKTLGDLATGLRSCVRSMRWEQDRQNVA